MKPFNSTSVPDSQGHFGIFGGRYIPEILMPLILEVEAAYTKIQGDETFWQELQELHTDYIGRPSPLLHAKRFGAEIGNNNIYFKREELNHTGAHKINNCIGQILLAKRMGKTRIIAETGAGQHGVATATACALFGLECVVYMGKKDIERQKPNVFRMRLLGAKIVEVNNGTKTLKDAMNEALRDWSDNVENTYYCIGTAAGPHPYPAMVRDFQQVIGIEAREQILHKTGRLPHKVMACVGGGSNAIGLFYGFLQNPEIELIGIEPAGLGVETGEHCASLCTGKPGVLHGNMTYLLQNSQGQIADTYSISAGLDYPGVGPEHSWLKDQKLARYESVTDAEALDAFETCCQTEGIIPALEPSHALAYCKKIASTCPDEIILINLCGRGDKDLHTAMKHFFGYSETSN